LSPSPNGPFDLSKTPIHLGTRGGAESPAVPLDGFGFDPEAFMAYIGEHCEAGAPGRLVMVETTPADWTTWERHTEGAEIVIILEGRGTFIQEIDGEERGIPYEPGAAIVNPAGVWHTADVSESTRAIYITPCQGTEHRERVR
jgi:mannose-6-phosphate isomerase-like protein (cupin superfamily)